MEGPASGVLRGSDVAAIKHREDHRLWSRPATIGCLARFKSRKGLLELVKAGGLLRDRFPGLRIRVAGTPSSGSAGYEQELRDRIARDGLTGGDVTLGAGVTLEDVPRFLDEINVLVQPSTQEGLGVVLLEAMASGVPIVANNCDGFREIATHNHNAYLTAGNDPAQLADAVSTVMQDGELRSRLARNGLAFVQGAHALNDMIDQTVALYREVMSPYTERSSGMPENLEEDEMARGRFANVRRDGSSVLRSPINGNSGARALLRHFEAAGCPFTPRLLEVSAEYERLTYVEGRSGYPPLAEELRSEDALVSVARAVKAVHDASATFPAGPEHEWYPLEACRPVQEVDIIGHGDLGPWNIIFNGSDAVGIIDWDTAGPMTRSWDLAYLAHWFVPFHADNELEIFGWDTVPDRRARLALLCKEYDGVLAEDVVDDAILRLYSVGVFLGRRVRAGDPRYEVQRRDGHSEAFMSAGANLARARKHLLS